MFFKFSSLHLAFWQLPSLSQGKVNYLSFRLCRIRSISKLGLTLLSLLFSSSIFSQSETIPSSIEQQLEQ